MLAVFTDQQPSKSLLHEYLDINGYLFNNAVDLRLRYVFTAIFHKCIHSLPVVAMLFNRFKYSNRHLHMLLHNLLLFLHACMRFSSFVIPATIFIVDINLYILSNTFVITWDISTWGSPCTITTSCALAVRLDYCVYWQLTKTLGSKCLIIMCNC